MQFFKFLRRKPKVLFALQHRYLRTGPYRSLVMPPSPFFFFFLIEQKYHYFRLYSALCMLFITSNARNTIKYQFLKFGVSDICIGGKVSHSGLFTLRYCSGYFLKFSIKLCPTCSNIVFLLRHIYYPH